MSAFKAYDFRGVFGIDFTLEDVFRIGFYLPSLLQTQSVLVGRDVRHSSPALFEALARGINSAGADVIDLGVCTTPMVYWATARNGFRASVMITASHNPPEYNGMKISGENALPVGYDNGLSDLENRIKQPPVVVEHPGKIIPLALHDEYLTFLRESGKYDFSGLKLVIDCGNGMAGLFAQKLFGPNVLYLFENPDGSFPNHDPNPLEEKNLEELKYVVRENKADLGVVFDGDADRVMFVDENGAFISPDLMIAALAHYYAPEGKLEEKVLQDIRTSQSVSEHLTAMGADVHIWRVGRAFAARKLMEINGLFGGELAGHYYFRDFYYSDSGLLAALRILHVMSSFKKQGISASRWVHSVQKYINSGELNFRIHDKEKAIQRVTEFFSTAHEPVKVYDFDGYRLEFKDFWFNIRPSNTEPYLRFIAEAVDENVLTEVVSLAEKLITEARPAS